MGNQVVHELADEAVSPAERDVAVLRAFGEENNWSPEQVAVHQRVFNALYSVSSSADGGADLDILGAPLLAFPSSCSFSLLFSCRPPPCSSFRSSDGFSFLSVFPSSSSSASSHPPVTLGRQSGL